MCCEGSWGTPHCATETETTVAADGAWVGTA